MGPLRDWDVPDRLGEITLPTLITSGRFDELTPALAEETSALIPGSKRVMFDQSSHMAHVEETARYLSVVGEFMRAAEVRARTGSRLSEAMA
jgi:L-proline amide hydrolase